MCAAHAWRRRSLEHDGARARRISWARSRPGQARSAFAIRSRYAQAPRPPARIARHMHTHHVDCSTLTPVHAAGAHDGGRRMTCPSSRIPSTIDPDHARKRRHHHPRDARRDLHRRHHARRSSSERVHVHAQRGQPWPQERRESAVFDASVPSDPGPGRVQPAAARGDHRVARGGLAHSLGVDGRFGRICTICHVRGSGNVNMLVTPRHVNACIQRVHVDVQTPCSSSAGAHVLPLRSASENRVFRSYEG